MSTQQPPQGTGPAEPQPLLHRQVAGSSTLTSGPTSGQLGSTGVGLVEVYDLDAAGLPYRVLYLDADDGVLINRFKETRRRHPLARIET
jgi:UPF0042 nucleotide-binding protein